MLSEKAMAPHSSTLAWRIPWTEEPGGLQSMRSLRVGHDWATSLSLFTFMHWRRNGNPLQGSCLENPRDGGAWWAAVYGVAQSRTRLKRRSSSRTTPSLEVAKSNICIVRQIFLISNNHNTCPAKFWEMTNKFKQALKKLLIILPYLTVPLTVTSTDSLQSH